MAEFNYEKLATQVNAPRNIPTTVASSAEELERNIEEVSKWIRDGKLSVEQKKVALAWLDLVNSASLDDKTRTQISNLKSQINAVTLTPEQIAESLRKNAQDPQKFDEFIKEYVKNSSSWSEHKKIVEFDNFIKMAILNQGYTWKINKTSIEIYDKNGNYDAARTASFLSIPDAATLIMRQSVYLKATSDTSSKSARERVQNIINGYNKQLTSTKNPGKRLDLLTDATMANPTLKGNYESEINSSLLAPEDKAIIVAYLRNPEEAESVFTSMGSIARVQVQNVTDATKQASQMVEKAGGHMEWSKANMDRWMRNPGDFVGEFISGMGGWVAPASLYLILNLFGIGHDSLFMKILAGATIVGSAKSLGALDFVADAVSGKSKTVNDATAWVKKTWNTSREDGFIRWVSDVWGDTTKMAKETMHQIQTYWKGYSDYYIDLTRDGKKETISVMKAPFEHVLSGVKSGTFNAAKSGGKTLREENELADFSKLVQNLDGEGNGKYGTKAWLEMKTSGKTLAEMIDTVHSSTPATVVGAGATAVAGAAGTVASAVGDAAKSAADTTKGAADAIAKAARPMTDWSTGTESPEQKEAREKKEAERATEWKKGEASRNAYTKRVLDNTDMVKAWNEKKENKEKGLKVEQYLEFINSEGFQFGVTLEGAFDFAGPDRRSLAVSIPSNFDTRTFTQIFRQYFFNTTEILPKGKKENYFNDKKNEPFAKKSIAEFMTK